jgi:hypothetical protein
LFVLDESSQKFEARMLLIRQESLDRNKQLLDNKESNGKEVPEDSPQLAETKTSITASVMTSNTLADSQETLVIDLAIDTQGVPQGPNSNTPNADLNTSLFELDKLVNLCNIVDYDGDLPVSKI